LSRKARGIADMSCLIKAYKRVANNYSPCETNDFRFFKNFFKKDILKYIEEKKSSEQAASGLQNANKISISKIFIFRSSLALEKNNCHNV
jgi:hypothetical protein